MIAWAKQLGKNDAIKLLQANLDEEKHADKLLSEIAEATVNQKAAASSAVVQALVQSGR